MPNKQEKLAAILREQNRLIDDAVAELRADLDRMLAHAIPRVQTWLAARLKAPDGQVEPSKRTRETLRRLALQIKGELKRAGLDQRLEQWSATFARQMPLFNEVLDLMGLPAMDWTRQDIAFLANSKLSAEEQVRGVMEAAANAVRDQALFSLGGLPLSRLYETIQKRMAQAPAVAANIADTAATIFLRSVHERGYARIEETQSEPLRFRFVGPHDKLERPFCDAVHQGKAIDRHQGKRRLFAPASTADDGSYTRAEIGRMDNGQLPNVMLSGGGYRCRHQWVVAALVPAAHVDRAPERRDAPLLIDGTPERLATLYREAWRNTPESLRGVFGRLPAVGLAQSSIENGYRRSTNTILVAKEPTRDFWAHETFHHVDYSLAAEPFLTVSADRRTAIGQALADESRRLSSDLAAQKALAAMIRHELPKDLYAADFFSALTMGRIVGGHKPLYYMADPDRRFREAFANLGALYSRSDRTAWGVLMRESGEVAKAFERWLRSVE